MIARYLLGVILVVFGLNGFINFLPPPEFGPAANDFIGALIGSGYLWTLEKAVEVLVGVLLLSNRYVPLALVVLAPITINILAFHLFLDIASIPPGLLVAILNFYLAWVYRDAYAPLFKAKAD